MTLLDDVKQQIDSHKVISFDIFDTLLLRPYVKPTDLFLHLEFLESIQGFAKARIEAEKKARKTHKVFEDVTIDEIYDLISDKYKNFKQKEMGLERQVLLPNPEIKEVYDYAKKQKKYIVIISDMYLPEKFLSSVLKEKGFSGFEKVYVSNEFRKKKGSGYLYQYVKNNIKVSPKDILHIGDNKGSDFDVARREGFDAFWYEQVIARYLKQNEKAKLFLEKYPDNLEVSVMIMNFALHWLKNPNEEFWSRIGYEYGGPMCYAYMRWIEEQVIKEGIKEILFVARDGYSLQKVFDSFGHKDIKTHYVYAPRQVAVNCNIEKAIKDKRDFFLLKNYRIKNNIISEKSAGITQKNAKTFIDENIELFRVIEASEKQNYAEYIKSINIGKNACIIDTTSSLLSSVVLLNNFLGYKPISFFWILHHETKDTQYNLRSFSKHLYSREYMRGCWDFYEYIMTSPEAPIIDVNDKGAVYEIDIPPSEKRRMELYPVIHSSILEFSSDIKNIKLAGWSEEMINNWVKFLFQYASPSEKKYLSQVEVANDVSHRQYRPLYDFSKNSPKGAKNITKYSVLGIPLLETKSTNYYSFEFNDNCVKGKIKVLGLPLFKSIASSWFYKLSICGMPLMSFKNTDTKRSLHMFGFPLYKITNSMKETTKQQKNKPDILTKNDFYKMMVENNRVMERKLSTFALHQKTFPQFKGINKGKDVVIVATGPSLSEFKPIKGAIYIGVNRAIQFDKIHYDYYFIQDFSGATPSYIEQVCNYRNCKKFMGLTNENTSPQRTVPEIFGEGEDIFRYRTDWENIPSFETRFAYDLATTALGCGGTVVLPALQFALWTHPKRIYLVGCDTTTQGYFDNKENNANLLYPEKLQLRYAELKRFAQQYYPDVEIISINPVGLKGIFTDEYQ